jgi:hypothetical protein
VPIDVLHCRRVTGEPHRIEPGRETSNKSAAVSHSSDRSESSKNREVKRAEGSAVRQV